MTMKRLVDGEIVLFTAEEEAEFKENSQASASLRIRADRNNKLKESDWTQVADAPVDQSAWAAYRQALRDITDNSNFPDLSDSDWPVAP